MLTQTATANQYPVSLWGLTFLARISGPLSACRSLRRNFCSGMYSLRCFFLSQIIVIAIRGSYCSIIGWEFFWETLDSYLVLLRLHNCLFKSASFLILINIPEHLRTFSFFRLDDWKCWLGADCRCNVIDLIIKFSTIVTPMISLKGEVANFQADEREGATKG